MTTKEAIKFAEYAQIMSDGKPDVQEFYKIAEAALREQEQEDPKPLTLDELRKMDREPVWCVSKETGKAEWAILRITEMSGTRFIAFGGITGAYGSKDTYGKTWLAYRHKPKEEV